MYKCDAINQAIDQPLSSEIKLSVLFGPTNLVLNGIFEAKNNEIISASCTSDASNPAPKLMFIFDGVEYEPLTQSVITTTGSIINATFSKNISREHNGKELKCSVDNKAASIQKTVSKTISVLCKTY